MHVSIYISDSWMPQWCSVLFSYCQNLLGMPENEPHSSKFDSVTFLRWISMMLTDRFHSCGHQMQGYCQTQPVTSQSNHPFWYKLRLVMLLTLKEDDAIDSFYLCHVLCVLSMIIKSGVICTRVLLYTIIICAVHGSIYVSMYAIGHYMCTILLALCVSTVVCIYMWIIQNYR